LSDKSCWNLEDVVALKSKATFILENFFRKSLSKNLLSKESFRGERGLNMYMYDLWAPQEATSCWKSTLCCGLLDV